MVRLNVNPTRMELTKLTNRLKTASRGYKLLKDKQDELMRKFIVLAKETNKLRIDVEKELSEAMKSFMLANASSSSVFQEELFAVPYHEVNLDIFEQNIMSVQVPKMNFEHDETELEQPFQYGYVNSSIEIDQALSGMRKVLPKLLELAEQEKKCQLLASEIEKTRRRVNALEYMTIPQLEETIQFIKMKLDENERSSITRLIKIKNMS